MEVVEKMNSAKDNFAPTIVLVLICLIVTFVLALTYSATAPVIEAMEIENANIARSEVLPEGDTFTEVDGTLNEGVADVFTADNGAGVVITTYDKGFGGQLTVMTGIDSEGSIVGINVLSHSETPGLGTKAMTDEHYAQYIGESRITNSGGEGAQVDAVTGATITSNALFRAVDKALTQYEELGGAR